MAPRHSLAVQAGLLFVLVSGHKGLVPPARLDFLQGPNPLNVDPLLDCGLRSLAYEYALTLMPERAPLGDVYDALRLGSECGLPPPVASATPAFGDVGAVLPPPVTAVLTTVYADPIRGDDGGDGSFAKPFKTVLRALEASRGGPSPAAIILRNGTFYLPAPLLLTATDANLSISAYPGEAPVLSGGAPLPALTWTLVRNSSSGGGLSPIQPGMNNVDTCGIQGPGDSSDACWFSGTSADAPSCAGRCATNSSCTSYTWHDASCGSYSLMCYLRHDGVWAPDAQGGHFSGYKTPSLSFNVWTANVSGAVLPFDTLFVGNRRAVRARYPNGNPETSFQPTGFVSAKAWHAPAAAPPPEEIHVSSPSRNFDPFFPSFQWGVGGTCGGFDPPEGFWCTKSPPAGNQWNVPAGFDYTPSSLPNAANWTGVSKGIVVRGK